jgi:hypothetical protein
MRSQCCARNSFQLVLRPRSGAGSTPCRLRMLAYRAPCQTVAEIRQRAHNPRVAPVGILAGHLHHQRFSLSLSSACGNTVGRAIVLPSDQLPVPSQQSLRRDNCCDFRKSAAAESFRFRGEPSALVVGETKSSPAELLTQYPVFLPQVVDCVLLSLSHPASNGNDHKPERIETRHRVKPTMAGLPDDPTMCVVFRAFQYLDTTGYFAAPGESGNQSERPPAVSRFRHYRSWGECRAVRVQRITARAQPPL